MPARTRYFLSMQYQEHNINLHFYDDNTYDYSYSLESQFVVAFQRHNYLFRDARLTAS